MRNETNNEETQAVMTKKAMGRPRKPDDVYDVHDMITHMHNMLQAKRGYENNIEIIREQISKLEELLDHNIRGVQIADAQLELTSLKPSEKYMDWDKAIDCLVNFVNRGVINLNNFWTSGKTNKNGKIKFAFHGSGMFDEERLQKALRSVGGFSIDAEHTSDSYKFIYLPENIGQYLISGSPELQSQKTA